MRVSHFSVLLLISFGLVSSPPKAKADPALAWVVGGAVAACGALVAGAYVQGRARALANSLEEIRNALEEKGWAAAEREQSLESARRLLRNAPAEKDAILEVLRDAKSARDFRINLDWHSEMFEATPHGKFDPAVWFRNLALHEEARLIDEVHQRGWHFFSVRKPLARDTNGDSTIGFNRRDKVIAVRLSPAGGNIAYAVANAARMVEAEALMESGVEPVRNWVCDLLGPQPTCDPLESLLRQFANRATPLPTGEPGVRAFVFEMGGPNTNDAEALITALEMNARLGMSEHNRMMLTDRVAKYLAVKHTFSETWHTYERLSRRRPEFRGKFFDAQREEAAAEGMSPDAYLSQTLIESLDIQGHPQAEKFLPRLRAARLVDVVRSR